MRNDEQFDSAKYGQVYTRIKTLRTNLWNVNWNANNEFNHSNIIFFFAGESFFKGQTLGKATFGLRTVLKDKFEHPSMGKILIAQ